MKAWLVLLALGAPTVVEAETFRCGTKLIYEGDTRAEVVSRCGDPTEIDQRSVWRRPLIWFHGRPYHVGTDLVEIPVEIWTYNLGPHKLMRRLRFEDGRVVEIE